MSLPQTATAAALVERFARVGVDGVFAETARVLVRGAELDAELQERRHAAEALEADLTGRLVAGTVNLQGAVAELAAVPPVPEHMVSALRRRLARGAERAARDEAPEAFERCAELCAAAIDEAVAAGRECCDVDTVAKVLARASALDGDRLAVVPLVAQAELADAWPAAAAATARVAELRAAGEVAAEVGGFGARFWKTTPIGARQGVAELVPEPLILAVGRSAGWNPRLARADGPSHRVEAWERAMGDRRRPVADPRLAGAAR